MQVNSTQRTGNARLLIFPPKITISGIAKPLQKEVKNIDPNAILMHPTNPCALPAVEAHMSEFFQKQMTSPNWLNGFQGLDADQDTWKPESVTKLYMAGLKIPELRQKYLQALPEKAQKLLQGLWNRHANSVILLNERNAGRFRNPYSAILETLQTAPTKLTTQSGQWVQVGNVEHFVPNPKITEGVRGTQISQALNNPVTIGNSEQGRQLLQELKEETKTFNQEA